jgi:integrase
MEVGRVDMEEDRMAGLTLKRVAKLVHGGRPARHADSGGVKGLYLVVTGKGTGSWQLRYQLRHKAHWMGLGSAGVFTLLEARPRATKAKQMLADGVDPLIERRHQRAAQAAAEGTTKTFRACAEAYIRDHAAEWKSGKHGGQWRASLRQYVLPLIGDLDVSKIGRPHVLAVLEQPVPAALGYRAGQLWTARSVTASRVRSRIELILGWAKARDYRTVKENPAAWSDLKHVLPAPAKITKVKNLAAVSYVEMPELMRKLRATKGVSAQAMMFEVMTATRPSEACGAVWSEIDLDAKTWTIPATRMKGGEEHIVPLSAPAIELLRSLPTEAGNPHVFLGSRQPRLSIASLSRQLQRLGYAATAHGTARSSFATWAGECTSFSNHAIELSLAHAIGNATSEAYRRGEMLAKRRKLMQAWATYLVTAPAKSTTKVTPIGVAR